METEPRISRELIAQLRALSQPLKDDPEFTSLLERIGQAPLVLLGEASHGSSEYYQLRTAISKKLIEEKKFSFLAVEGDWPDCFLVNQYIKAELDPSLSARGVLSRFRRWPTWLWANEEVIDLIEWLKLHNDGLPKREKVGFYGLDVYSLWESLATLSQHLKSHDPDSLSMAEEVFACFDHFQEDAQEYARSTWFHASTCERELQELLSHLETRQASFEKQPEGHLQAVQNAAVLKNAEAYYRSMLRPGPLSWNIRDLHMADTLGRLMKHHGPRARGIVWEHNTHIGDARFTDMQQHGEVNVGQIMRERLGEEQVVLVGFSGYQGSVIAAHRWEAAMQTMQVPAGRENSWEDTLHRVSAVDKLLIFSPSFASDELLETRGHRAIGVVYHPGAETRGNYVPTVLPRRYDALIYLDQTEALHPLRLQPILQGEAAETYPSAM